MTDLNALAVAIAAVAALVLSATWYVVFSAEAAEPGGAAAAGEQPTPWILIAELARSAVVATVVAGLASEMAVDGIAGGVLLGLVLFIGFPVVLFAGSILHEGYSRRLAAVHLGDWLLKLVLIGAIVGALE